MLLQRNCLLKCVPPVTKKQLPPPVLVQASSLVVAMREARNAAETLKPILPPPVIEDDGTEFSRAFLRRGVPEAANGSTSNERDPAKRLAARRALQALARCNNKRKI